MSASTAPPADPEATRLLVPRAPEPPTVHISRPASDQPTRPIALPRTVYLTPRRATRPRRATPAATRPPIVEPKRLRLPFGTLLAAVLLVTAMGGASSAGLRAQVTTTAPAPPAAVSPHG